MAGLDESNPASISLLNSVSLIMNLFSVAANTLQVVMMLNLTKPIEDSEYFFDSILQKYVPLPVHVSIFNFQQLEHVKQEDKYRQRLSYATSQKMCEREAMLIEDVYNHITSDSKCYEAVTERIALAFMGSTESRNHSVLSC